MLSGPVQRSVSRVWVQECDTNGLWHEETAICRQVKWLHASISEVKSFMAICSFWRNALSNTSTASWPNSLGCKQGAGWYAGFQENENEWMKMNYALATYAANCSEKNNTHLRWETYLYSHGISLESFWNVIIQTALSSFKGHGAVKLAGHNGTCQSLFTVLPKEQCHLLALIKHSPHKQVVEVKGDGQRDLSKAAVCWDLSTACGWKALILQDG